MKLAFFINTPAQVHLHKNTIRQLETKGHQVKILARKYGDTIELLNELRFEYFMYADVPESKYGKFLSLPVHVLTAYNFLRGFNPDLLIGMGVYSAYTSQLLRKPCVIFNDSEPTPIQFMLFKPFVSVIITPSCFNKELGKKHIKINGYKEFAYLHPNHFRPDDSIFDLLEMTREEDFILLRFNAFDAVHDIGVGGFSLDEKRTLVDDLKKYARVFISSETELPDDLEEYSIRIPKYRIHDVLYYAKMVVADTQTMITEAGILGTPAIRYNSFVGKKDMGNFIELEQKYNLIFNYNDPDKAIEKAVELIRKPDLKEVWGEKRKQLLRDKVDLTEFMVGFIEDYPGSFEEIKKNPEFNTSSNR